MLVALSLEALWNDRGERAAEHDLLVGLRAEFQENARSLGRWVALHERVVTSTEQFIALVEAVPEGQAVAVPDSVLGDMTRTPTYDPELNSLDAALSSGQIVLIRSVEVQRSLANWSRLLADAQEEEERGANLVYSQMLPYLSEVTDLGPAMLWIVPELRRMMEGRPSEASPTSSSMVIGSRELANLLWIRYRISSASANELRILLGGLDEVLALLDAELR